jgi:hypothetical protein
MSSRSKQPTTKPAHGYNHEALWTRIQGRAGIYQVLRAEEDTHQVDVRAAQPTCDCDTYRLRVAKRRTGAGAACPHIAALRDCGFLAA